MVVATREALACGVRIGMRSGGVSTIAPGTVILERSQLREQQALDALAMSLLQYTPEIAFADDFSIVMDVTASLRLFGGVLSICHRIKKSIASLGFTAQIGTGPTALGAWLLARRVRSSAQTLHRRTLTSKSLARHIDRLPVYLLPQTAAFSEWLTGIDAVDFGALRRLPRPGLMRRTNKALVEALDMAYGATSEIFEWIKIPSEFSAHVETFDRIEHAEALMFGATRLILQMTGWLTVQQLAVTSFSLLLEHERGRTAMLPTSIDILLAEPTWKEPHLLRLLTEHLAKVQLVAPVIGLRLEARKLVPMVPPTDQLFPEPGGTPADFNRLLELLSARLGVENILAPSSLPDHRPEECDTWVSATRRIPRSENRSEVVKRPFWILPKPIVLLVRDHRPFYGSPLKLIEGPERIEAGWWSENAAARDYFTAQGADGSCYWIFLERAKEDARWFLHGLYG